MDRRYGLGWFAAVVIACVMSAGCGGGGTAALLITTTSLPNGTVNTPYNFIIQPSGGTPPYTWSQAGGGAMPPGITFSSGGDLTGVPTTAGSYGPYNLKVTDANNNTATSVGLNIKINASTLSVTTTSLPNGTIGTPYSATFAATGGKSPYSWSEISGGALPPGLTTASGSGVITGTPTTDGTYGPYVFQVTDENFTTATSGPVTIVISGTATAVCAPGGSEGLLTATTPYAFLLKGTDKSGNPLEIAGSFTPNGAGGLTSAVADYNGTTDGPQQLAVNLAASSYSFNSSTGQGCLYLLFSGLATSSSVLKANAEPAYLAPSGGSAGRIAKPAIVAVPVSNVQFSFYLSELTNSIYTTGRIIESDAATSGTNAAGMIYVQVPGATLQATNYAFGVDGWTTTAATSGVNLLRTAMAGAFTYTRSSGAVIAGYADVNTGGTASGELTNGYGTLANSTFNTTTGRGTGSYFVTTPTGPLTYDFAYYVLNGSDFLLISTAYTQNTSTTPLLAGRALASTTNYVPTPLNGYYLLASEGYQSLGTSIGNVAQIGTLNATSAGLIPTASVYSNYARTYSTNQYSGTYSVEAASGRTSLAGILTNSPVVYLTNTTPDDGIVGFLVGTDNQASSGVVVNQTAAAPNYSLASVTGAYPVGTAEDVDGKNGSFLGDFSFTGAGAYTIVSSQTTGTLTNVPSLGSIAINADGSGNLDGGNFPLVTNGQVIFAISNSGDPLLYVFEEGTLP